MVDGDAMLKNGIPGQLGQWHQWVTCNRTTSVGKQCESVPSKPYLKRKQHVYYKNNEELDALDLQTSEAYQMALNSAAAYDKLHGLSPIDLTVPFDANYVIPYAGDIEPSPIELDFDSKSPSVLPLPAAPKLRPVSTTSGTKKISIRIPHRLVAAFQDKVAQAGVGYQTLMIRALARAVAAEN